MSKNCEINTKTLIFPTCSVKQNINPEYVDNMLNRENMYQYLKKYTPIIRKCKNCLPVMDDGTVFTSYMNSGVMNYGIASYYNLQNNDTKYRNFLQNNSDKFLKKQSDLAFESIKCHLR